MTMKVLIIGGVAGGATAAARLRRLDEKAEIIILERSGYISYANCGLPYYIGGVIKNKANLTLQTPESFWIRFRIDVRVRNEAIAIDAVNKTVTVRRLDDGSEYTETYDKLILSPGAKAIRPGFPGIDDKRIFTLRTVEDTFAIHDYIETASPKSAVVVGGGFIGLEMAENLINSGIDTTLIQLDDHVMTPVDYDMACEIHSYLRGKGLTLRLGETVESFESNGSSITTHIKDRQSVNSDMVVLAIGVTPESALAKTAGLKLGIKESISVDNHMRTSVPDIYAVGDAVEITNTVTGEKSLISLAGPANKQGRVAADNICGIDSTFDGAQGSSIIKLFDMTVAATGINEKTAEAAGIKYDKTVTFSASHATYYPGAVNMSVKTLFEPDTGRIIGAQIVGFDGVDKRIDVMATAIKAKMTSDGLEELDLAYAPPYSSAKDPVNMAGFVIGNIRRGLVKQHHWYDVENLIGRDGVTLLDVRMKQELDAGVIPGSINIPLDELRDHIDKLDKSKKIYVNCVSGLRSYIACRILTGYGFDCSNLSGGYRFYSLVMKNKEYDSTPKHPCGLNIK